MGIKYKPIKCRIGIHKWKDISTASDVEKQIVIDGDGGIWVRHSCEKCGHTIMDHAPLEFEMGFNMGRQYGKPQTPKPAPQPQAQAPINQIKLMQPGYQLK